MLTLERERAYKEHRGATIARKRRLGKKKVARFGIGCNGSLSSIFGFSVSFLL